MTEELERESQMLEDMNAALRVVLQQREEDKTELEKIMLTNIKDLILPSLKNLKDTHLGDDQRAYINTLEANLEDIASPFLNKLSTSFVNLTPREIEIANYVKTGRTTKEIATLLHVSEAAVERHRKHLRRKLGLTHQEINLQAYLRSQMH